MSNDFDPGAIDINLGQTSEPIISDGQPVESPDSLLNPFLKEIPEADRNVVAPYISKWDSGVTKKFQEIHDSYKPYKELGMEPDKLAQAVELYRILDQEPERVYEILKEMLEVSNDNSQEPVIETGEPPVIPEFEGIPPQFIDKFSKMEAALEQLSGYFTQQQQREIEQQEAAELDTLLERMHTKHGEFDDEFVIAKLAAGLDPQAAIDAYTSFVEKLTAPKNRPAPSLLGGAGGVPTGQVNPKDMSPAETRDFIARALAAQNNS